MMKISKSNTLRRTGCRLYLLMLYVCCNLPIYAEKQLSITLEMAVDRMVFATSSVRAELLTYENKLMEYENYRKSFLPSFSFNISPLNLNHAMRLLQDANSGGYHNVDNFSNQMSSGFSISQQIGPTGGSVNMSSSLSFLRDYSKELNSFSTTPFHISYSQSILGGYRRFKYNKRKKNLEKELALKKLCAAISVEQKKILDYYLAALRDMIDKEFYHKCCVVGDSIIQHAAVRLSAGKITDYEYKQLKLEQVENKLQLHKADMGYRQNINLLQQEIGMQSVGILLPDCSRFPRYIEDKKVIQLVMSNNPELLEEKIKLLDAENIFKDADLATRFNADLSVSYGLNQYARIFSDAYKRPSSQQAVSLSLNIPVFQWGINKNKRRIARNNYQKAIMDVQKERHDKNIEIQECVITYNHNISLFAMAEDKYELAISLQKQARQKFISGKLSAIELSHVSKQCIEAKKERTKAMKDVLESYYKLRDFTLYDFVQERNLSEMVQERISDNPQIARLN